MNSIEKILNEKTTENGDITYKSTGNPLLDIIFMTAFFETHLDSVRIGTSDKEKLLSMFVRDPRFGLGRRDLGRVLLKQSGVSAEDILIAGRYDDLYHIATEDCIDTLMADVKTGNELAKKWMPRLTGKDKRIAKALCKIFHITEKEYRKLIKCESTTEYKLSYAERMKDSNPLVKLFDEGTYTHPLVETINFEHIPSLAMIKYFNCFIKRDDIRDRFQVYLADVKSGKKKLNVSTTNVYDIYKNRDNIDADLFFDKLPKITLNCIPVLDTSGSMWDGTDSIGKAISIAHYLSKCSTYCPDYLVSFSKNPKLMKIKEVDSRFYRSFGISSKYARELNSMYTGDVAENTDFGKVMELFKSLETLPEYLVVLSDMEFDSGSHQSKVELQKLWKDNGYNTKIVWWNFNSRNMTAPETDDMGNIYLSGYSPQLLAFLNSEFDGNRYLDKLLEEYAKNIEKGK